MVFTNPYKKILLYIKLKLWEDEQGDHGQVISFHPEGMHEKDFVNEKMSCPKCEALRDVQEVARDEITSINGREVVFRAIAFRCDTCGEEFETPSQFDANLHAAREAYSRAMNPSALRNSLRSGHGTGPARRRSA